MRQDTTISGFTGSKTKDNRYLSKLSLPTNSISSNAEERTELDSHADTCIAGQNYVVQHFTGLLAKYTRMTNHTNHRLLKLWMQLQPTMTLRVVKLIF